MKKIDLSNIEHTLFQIFLIFGVVFVVGYCSYPLVGHYFVSVEKANKSNVKKFERNKDFLQEVINTCVEIYTAKPKETIWFSDVPEKMQNKLNRKGIGSFYVKIEKTDEIKIYAYFHTYRHWQNSILNNVDIMYSSIRKFDKCDNKNIHPKAIMFSICLGDGWFFYVDTDWL